jgi:hypothetical protein
MLAPLRTPSYIYISYYINNKKENKYIQGEARPYPKKITKKVELIKTNNKGVKQAYVLH